MRWRARGGFFVHLVSRKGGEGEALSLVRGSVVGDADGWREHQMRPSALTTVIINDHHHHGTPGDDPSTQSSQLT